MNSAVRVRSALPGDEVAMRAITRLVWQGTDYVPLVWDRWVDDSRGLLQVATMDGRVVGFQHVAIQPDGAAWLEGIRVDESARGGGVGRVLLQAGLEYARLAGCLVARLSTASINPASNHLAESGGFREVARFQPLVGRGGTGDTEGGVRLAQGFDLDEVAAFVTGAGQRFYTEGWTAYELTRDRLRLLLNTDAVAVTGETAVEGVAIATCREPFRDVSLGYLAGSDAALRELSGWVARRVTEAEFLRLRGNVLAGPSTQAALAGGFEPAGEMEMVLYERALGDEPLTAEG